MGNSRTSTHLGETLRVQPISSTVTWWSSRNADTVWAALTAVDRYGEWWPWLEEFDGDTPAVDTVLEATIRAPARYRVRYSVTFTEVAPSRVLAASIAGDLVGSARIELTPASEGTVMNFAWDLRPERPLLRGLGWIAAPVLVRGHDQIIARGARQFTLGSGVDLQTAAPEG